MELALILALISAAPDEGAIQQNTQTAEVAPVAQKAELQLTVFFDDLPIPGVTVRLNNKDLGTSDVSGSVFTSLDAGRHPLQLIKDGKVAANLDLIVVEGEVLQVIANLYQSAEAEFLIETSKPKSDTGEVIQDPTEEASDVDTTIPPGALVGYIKSAEDGKPVKKAQLFFSGTTKKAQTDRKGYFEIELPAGTYSVSIIHQNFASQTLSNIRVISEKQIDLAIELAPAGVRLRDYVVTAPYVQGTIGEALEDQQNSSVVIEALGVEQMKKTGDSSAADALQRVTGLTVIDGKYVVVRGQPFRYTLTLWNGSPMPGPEPLIRVVPLDLFPVSSLAGIEVQKAFSADRPGDFGSGLVNLKTRGMPEEPFLEISVRGSVNTVSTFTDGLSYEGGGLDFLGFDDGSRALPGPVDAASNGQTRPIRDGGQAAASFSNNYNPFSQELPPDISVGIAGGYKWDLPNDGELGFIAATRWSNRWRTRVQEERRYVIRFASRGLEAVIDQVTDRTDFEAELGGLAVIEAKWGDNHRISSNTFYAHQTQQRVDVTTGLDDTSDELDILATDLIWIERSLLAEQIRGYHIFDRLRIDYRALLSKAFRDSPDRRSYAYERNLDNGVPTSGFRIQTREGNTSLLRSFNEVEDTVWNIGLDLEYDFLREEKSWLKLKAKVGGDIRIQERESRSNRYAFDIEPTLADATQTNPEILLNPALLTDPTSGVEFFDGSFTNIDDFDGTSNVYAAYGQVDFNVSDRIRLVTGVRLENADFDLNTIEWTNNADPEPIPNESGFNEFDILPAAALTYFLTEKMQVRLSYGKTVSRPVLNELSPAPYEDPDSGDGFVGREDLIPTSIHGLDARWEWYPTSTQYVTFGAFYKRYENPIDLIVGTQGDVTFANADYADVFGIEASGRFEGSQLVDWFDWPEMFESFYIQANGAILDSTVTNTGVTNEVERPLPGQASYIFNTQFGVAGAGHEGTIALVGIGEEFFRASDGNTPDIFIDPRYFLDIVYRWKITENITLSAKAGNLLDTPFTFKQGDAVWRDYKVGTTFSLGIKGKI